MNATHMLDEVNSIRELIVAFESLDSLQYEAAAECAFEALKSQVDALKSVLEEETRS